MAFRATKRQLVMLGPALILAPGLIAWSGRASRGSGARDPAPAVATIRVERTPLSTSLTLSGEFRPFQEVDLHAKVAGYIRTISVDVGERVQRGQVLAVLEVPELSAQVQGADASSRRSEDAVRRAQSELEKSESAAAAAHSAYARLREA